MANLTDVEKIDALAEQLSGVRAMKESLAAGNAVSFDVYCKDQLSADMPAEDIPLSIPGVSASFSAMLDSLETNLLTALAALGVT